MAPQTGGAHTLYTKFFQPFLKAHSEEINAFIKKAQSAGSELQKEGMAQATAMAKDATSTENLNKAAQFGLKAQEQINQAAAQNDTT